MKRVINITPYHTDGLYRSIDVWLIQWIKQERANMEEEEEEE